MLEIVESCTAHKKARAPQHNWTWNNWILLKGQRRREKFEFDCLAMFYLQIAEVLVIDKGLEVLKDFTKTLETCFLELNNKQI